jgi:hypothetical protein
MRYSAKEGRWYGQNRSAAAPGPNPYSPDSPGFTERNRQTETDLGGGLIRVDMGEPIGGKVAAKPQRSTRKAPATPPATPPTNLPTVKLTPQPAPADPLEELRGRFKLSNALDG